MMRDYKPDMAGDIKLVAAPRPFAVARMERTLPAGGTIAELLIAAGITLTALTTAHVFVGDVLVAPEYWERVRPKPNQRVTVRVVPQGGGGGNKSALRIVLTLAVIAAAVYTQQYYLANIGGTTTLASGAVVPTAGASFGAGLAGAAVTTAGYLAVNAIAPPALPKLDQGGGGAAASPSFAITGQRNQKRPWDVIPYNLGRNRIWPPFACAPYSEVRGNDLWFRAAYLVGFGPQHLEELKIGETAIGNFDDPDTAIKEIDIKVRQGLEDDDPIPGFTRTVDEQALSIELKESDGWVVRTTEPDCDEFTLDFTWTQGLVEFDLQGHRLARTVRLEVEYALKNSGNWSIGLNAIAVAARQSVSLPPRAVTNPGPFGNPGTPKTYPQQYRICLNRASGAIVVQQQPQPSYTTVFPMPPVPTHCYPLARLVVPPDGIITNAIIIDERTQELWDNTLATTDFKVTANGTPNDKVAIAAGSLAFPVDVTGNTPSVLRRATRFAPDNGQYDVRARRITPDSTSDRVFDKVFWTTLRSIKYEAPFDATGLCVVTAYIKSTGQLNGELDAFNCIATSIFSDYDAVNDEWLRRPTNNNASIYVGLLTGPGNAEPILQSRVDRAAFEAWAAICTGRGFEFNMYADFEGSLGDTLRACAAAGRAAPARPDGIYSIIQDRLQTEIVQHFTPRNSWGFEGTKTFVRRAHGLRVRFINAAAGYRQGQVIVYDDGYHKDNATILEPWEFPGVTTEAQIKKLGREHLAVAQLRAEQYSWFADFEHLVCTRGSLVRVTQDVLSWGLASGRIKALTDFGAAAAGLIHEADALGTLARWSANSAVSIAIVGGQLQATQVTSQANGDATFDHTLSAGKRVTVSVTVVNDVNERGFVCGGVYFRRSGTGGTWQVSNVNAANQPPWSTSWRWEIFSDNTMDWYGGDRLIASGISRVSGLVAARVEANAGLTQRYDDLVIDYQAVGVTLDEQMPMVSGTTYALRLRLLDGSFVSRVVTDPGETPTVTLVTPIALARVAIGDLAMFGEVDQESVELVIKSIARGPELSARLTAVDHAPGIFGAAVNAIPDPDPHISDIPGAIAPVIDSLRSGQAVLIRDDDGSLRPRILVSFVLAANRPYHDLDAIQQQFRNATPDSLWRNLPELSPEATETSIDHVQTGQTYELRFRFVYKAIRAGTRRAGPWTTRTHTVTGTASVPPKVPQFYPQGARLWWTYPQDIAPPNLAGFQIRERTGVDRTWAAARPVHAGLVGDSYFDVNQSERVVKTYLIKAIDTTGNESEEAAALTLNLNDTLGDNTVAWRDYAAEHYPGTITNATVTGTELQATDTGGLFWGADADLFWGADDTGLFWDSIYNPLVYEFEFIPDLYEGERPLPNPAWRMVTEFGGDDARLLYKPGDTSLFWSPIDANPFWGADTDLFWPPDESEFVAWPGVIENPSRQSYPLRVEIAGGAIQGKIITLQALTEVDDTVETLEDVAISALGTRLPTQRAWIRIKQAILTLQADGGTAERARMLDKATAGPLVATYDGAGAMTTGVVDAQLHGY